MSTPQFDKTNHGKRAIVAWIVLSVIAMPIVALVLGPHLPPGKGSQQASEQVFDNTWLVTTITPIVCLLVVFFVYTLAKFRNTGGDQLVDGPPLRNNARIQFLWIAISGLTALMLASFGTFELLQTGSGGGQGPSALVVPKGPKMQVQVIAQQWQFTYRYPAYGGVETPTLVIPADTLIEFHVTSLDAIHSFWAYELGVKADANPGEDNIAYVKTKGPETFQVRCAELCGLWHGYMFDTGRVVPMAKFTAWVKSQQADFAPVAKYLPKYSTTYFPDPQRRAG
jgi:cytochrome c oxidase subunit II